MKRLGFRLRGFKRAREVVTSAFGELERDVMTVAWRAGGEVSVRDVCRQLGDSKAYTTVMTLGRLYRKNLLTRRKSGRAYLYSIRVTREEFERGFAADVIEGLFSRAGGAAEPLLSCIVETVSERDRELLDELDRLVKQKKRELDGKEPK